MPPAEELRVNSPAFWEKIYREGRAGWDLGGPTPAFRRHLLAGALAPGRLMVLGAGRGHDAREFARHGFSVTAVDFADEPVRDMRALADPHAPVEILQSDIFQLPQSLNGAFDMLLEYTCYCAIHPSRRGEYADVVARLLRPGAAYLAMLFPLDDHAGGPPFAVSPAEFIALFEARGFRLNWREAPLDSAPQRRGIEELLLLTAPTSPRP